MSAMAKPREVLRIRYGSRSELDELTLQRARRGETDAWRALVETYQERVFALLSRLLRARSEAPVEDLAQETFIRLYEHAPR